MKAAGIRSIITKKFRYTPSKEKGVKLIYSTMTLNKNMASTCKGTIRGKSVDGVPWFNAPFYRFKRHLRALCVGIDSLIPEGMGNPQYFYIAGESISGMIEVYKLGNQVVSGAGKFDISRLG